MNRYDFECSAGHVHERKLPISSNVKRSKCPECGEVARRLIGAGMAINSHPVTSQYPYVSSRLPMGLPGCKTYGPMQKTVIESAAHEDRVFKTYGYKHEEA